MLSLGRDWGYGNIMVTVVITVMDRVRLRIL